MPQMSQILKEHAIDMVTAGMSSRAVDRELNVPTISRPNDILENLAERPIGLTIADHMYGVIWASGLLMSML